VVKLLPCDQAVMGSSPVNSPETQGKAAYIRP
jgi:hypothetical protein